MTPIVTRRVTDAVSLHRSPLPPTRPDPKVLTYVHRWLRVLETLLIIISKQRTRKMMMLETKT